jgi:peptide/nickel transport system substrate-binding protein
MGSKLLTNRLGSLLALALVLACSAAQAASEPDTLVIGYHRTANNFYPGANSALPNIMVNMLLYDSLVIHDHKGNLHPALAKSWEKSNDGLTWTFKLRDDVKFHSGRKFTAADVKAHFDTWKSLPTAMKIDALEEVKILDDYTVQCRLKYPTLVFLTMISQTEWSYSGIPDAEAVKKYGKDYGVLPESVSGTGPFVLKKWVRAQAIELERNPDYKWGSKIYQNAGPAHLKKVIIKTIPEEAARSAALERQEIDIDLSLSTKDAPRLKGKMGLAVLATPQLTVHTIGFNHKKPMWQDEKVRKAFMRAVDQKAIVTVAYNGFAEPAQGFFPEAMPGNLPKEEMAKIFPTYNPDLAKKLLDEAGWKMGSGNVRVKDGVPLRFTIYVYTETQAQLATVLQEQFRKIGADPAVKLMEYAAWQKAMREYEHDMRYVDGTTSSPDGASYWYVCNSIPYPNHVYWCDEKTDEFYKTTQTTLNERERLKAFGEFERRLIEKAVIIPMPHTMMMVGVWDTVKDLNLHPVHGIYKLLDAKKPGK